MIEKILPSTQSKVRILKAIYRNPGININQIIKEARTSPNLVIKYVGRLVNSRIVTEYKKSHMRELTPNLKSQKGELVFSLLETDKRESFLERYKEFRPIFTQLEDFFPRTKAKFCLIHGSFARFSADRTSDVDILIVGELTKTERAKFSEIFITLGREYSIEIEKPEDFSEKSDEPFHQTLIRDHIIIWGEHEFVRILGRLR